MKTAEEILDKHISVNGKLNGEQILLLRLWKEEILQAMESYKNQFPQEVSDGWIDVRERPSKDGEYLAWFKEANSPFIISYGHWNGWIVPKSTHNAFPHLQTITHWTELPKAPALQTHG